MNFIEENFVKIIVLFVKRKLYEILFLDRYIAYHIKCTYKYIFIDFCISLFNCAHINYISSHTLIYIYSILLFDFIYWLQLTHKRVISSVYCFQ